MDETSLIPHLFRTEYSKMVSVLTRSFGLSQMEVAEDMVSETFLSALHSWPYKGMPQNPTAWLYTVAKNKLKNYLNRTNRFNKMLSAGFVADDVADETIIDFSEQNIADSQLQMLFTICHPSISAEAQICLALRILCGFGLGEIASALLSTKEAIHKRLQRAKEKLYAEKIRIEMPGDIEMTDRLNTVNQTIYLLFSEGYYSESNNSIVRKELCVEALNLAYLLLRNPLTNNHATNALLSLMCFQASRLEARRAADGNMILYDEQDQALWDKELIEKGFYFLQQASKWEITSAYYVEASIAYWHTVDNNNPDKWTSILKLYDLLLASNYAPTVAMNRLLAFSKVHGNQSAIREAERLNLQTNHFYCILLAELWKHTDPNKSGEYLLKALQLCKTNTEKSMIQKTFESLHAKPAAWQEPTGGEKLL